MDVSVVLPTFNEAENLPFLIPRIRDALAQADLAGEVIVVDDGSPDGTAEVARQLGARVIERREERGLASAVLAGFAVSSSTVVVVMDADGSHPAAKLFELVQPVLRDEADVVVGSRRVPGGGAEAAWPWPRRLLSRAGGLLTAGLTPLRDATSGFVAVRRSLLEGLELDPVGFKIVLEIAVKAQPCRLREVAIEFSDRRLGQSKLGARVGLDFIRHLVRLHHHRRPALVEFVKFCLVGSLGLLVDLATVVALRETLSLDHRLYAAGGFAVAVTNNYLWNRLWTFPKGRQTAVLPSYLAFVGTCCVGLAVRVGVVYALTRHGPLGAGHWYVLANFLGIIAATLVNFTGARGLAFRAPRG